MLAQEATPEAFHAALMEKFVLAKIKEQSLFEVRMIAKEAKEKKKE